MHALWACSGVGTCEPLDSQRLFLEWERCGRAGWLLSSNEKQFDPIPCLQH